MKRTHLPLNGLRVLDAAARHLSFTRAADELAVTPAAVGQQIRALEDTLGVVLFRRTTKGLELTPEGEAGLYALRAGFPAIRGIGACDAGRPILQVAHHRRAARLVRQNGWCSGSPRSPRATARRGSCWSRPTKRSTSPKPISISRSAGARGRASTKARRWESEGMVTVERPGGGADTRIAWPGCLSDDTGSLVRVGDAGLALDAAAAGLGRATVPELLARGDIATGLVVTVGEPKASRLGYWLVAPLPQWRQKKVKALVDALAG